MSVTAVPLRPIAKGSVAKLWIGLLLLALAAAAFAWWGTAGFQPVTLPSGVTIKTVGPGSGAPITPHDVVALNYRLHLNSLTGPVVQDSREAGRPFVATTQEVYPGFAEGLQHMRQGGSYILSLPPGTGEQGPVPPGAPFTAKDTLVFEIDVLQIERDMAERYTQMRQMQQLQQQMQQQQGQQGGEGQAPPVQ